MVEPVSQSSHLLGEALLGSLAGENRMHVEVLRARGDVFKFRGKAMVGDKLAAEGEFAAMVVETP